MACTALHYAAMCGRARLSDAARYPDIQALAMVDLLLSMGAPVNAEDQVTAAAAPAGRAARTWVHKGTHNRACALCVLRVQYGFTALHCAAALGLDEVVAELLSAGAFMDVQDKQVRGCRRGRCLLSGDGAHSLLHGPRRA